MNNSLKVIVGILAVIALWLGYSVYVERAGSPSGTSTSSGGDVTAPAASDISAADRAALLDTPNASSTDEERSAHSVLVLKLAVPSNILDVTACVSNPAAITIKNGAELTLVNKDAEPHTIIFNADHFYTVPANGTSAVDVDFGNGAGIYGYGCDRSNGPVGMILVTE